MGGILNHQMTAGQALTGQGAAPMAAGTSGSTGGTGSSSDSSGDSATISANDFLTLLVTEMQNQDPTANTDPNEYINQLVSVNSLEQLIDINQTLSANLDGTTSGSNGSSPKPVVTAATSSLTGNSASTQVRAAAPKASTPATAERAAPASAAASNPLTQASLAKRAPGNLSIPDATPASLRVAQALGVRTHAQSLAGGLSGAQ